MLIKNYALEDVETLRQKAEEFILEEQLFSNFHVKNLK